MPFVMNQDIPETYEELKEAYIAECKERYENNERSRKLLWEEGVEIANLQRENEDIIEDLKCVDELLELKELQEEKERDTITEVRSARDKAIQEIKELREEVDRLKKMFCYSAVDMK